MGKGCGWQRQIRRSLISTPTLATQKDLLSYGPSVILPWTYFNIIAENKKLWKFNQISTFAYDDSKEIKGKINKKYFLQSSSLIRLSIIIEYSYLTHCMRLLYAN